ncbi:MAG: zinc metallopeptidase [Gammaproteobacteria bacterium]|nr:zinc metallopeptidase [Gammaproteobacteria bacterium]MBT8051102.1 zinc metallopeptidase [Gammaproteobacteria bacterium]MBT8056960.1 zinc metallopeptidase [Gammaproteobacteria bacterium]NNJ79222.1 zinc metallopeptidase [Xanthomonadales bacterium]NNK32167.1 zinc metallopeptidase [Xanthomonadales bacterium]
MHILVFVLVIFAVVTLPQLWVRRVMQRYSEPADRYPERGAETARRLLDAAGLESVRVENTEVGDHYDPIEKVVRLSENNYSDASLTATTIAAHEVGHAVQDASGFAPLRWRTKLVRWVGPVEKIGAGMMMATPLIIGITRLPYAGALMLLGGLMTLGSAVAVHLLTLPSEFDASFGRAMPMLEEHGVLYENDAPHARRLLKAAAMTYVAASLMSLLNVARWWAILRR